MRAAFEDRLPEACVVLHRLKLGLEVCRQLAGQAVERNLQIEQQRFELRSVTGADAAGVAVEQGLDEWRVVVHELGGGGEWGGGLRRGHHGRGQTSRAPQDERQRVPRRAALQALQVGGDR